MKFPINFTFEGGRRQTTTIFSFSYSIWNRAVRIRLQENFFFWSWGHICVAFLSDNAGTLNCYKLKTFVLLKHVVYFDSFYGFRLVDFNPF